MMMKEKYFKCTLLSDIVLNASLATEGNMTTLNYIPGSNFLGIVAGPVYKEFEGRENEVFHLFHTDKVSFGDAIITGESLSKFYPKPFMYFKDKLESDEHIYLHHLIHHNLGVRDNDGNKIQLKQERSGFVNHEGKAISDIQKTFALKSAQDRKTRSSKEGFMFGLESIKAGQTFVFSIKYENDSDINLIENYLTGKKYIGKSKTAQYGHVNIESINSLNTIGSFPTNDYILVYAESNLCFIDEVSGQSTFQPSVHQLGLKSGEINWEKSSIRTYGYSAWNFKRNTSNAQRNCIVKGSVFYVENGVIEENAKQYVGEYIAEGLGRIVYNPIFLKGKENWTLDFEINNLDNTTQISNNKPEPKEENIITALGKQLFNRYCAEKNEKEIAQNVINAILKTDWDLKSNITSSQWGNIRAIATDFFNSGKSYQELERKLGYEENQDGKIKTNKTGILTHGKMFDKMWDKNGRLGKLKTILDAHSNNSLVFIAKYAAEMAKIYIDIKNGKLKKEEK